MENGQVKIFVPRSGANAFPGANDKKVDTSASSSSDESKDKTHTIIKNGVEIDSRPKQRFIKGIGYFFGGLVVGTLTFIAAYFALSQIFNLGYVLLSLLSLCLAAGAIEAFNKGTGSMPTLMSGPLTIFLIITFVLSLLYGDEYGKGSNSRSEAQTEIRSEAPVETLTMTTTEDFPTTSRYYYAGERVKIVVIGNPVKMVLGNELGVGEHITTMDGNGKLCFHIETNAPAKVEIY